MNGKESSRHFFKDLTREECSGLAARLTFRYVPRLVIIPTPDPEDVFVATMRALLVAFSRARGYSNDISWSQESETLSSGPLKAAAKNETRANGISFISGTIAAVKDDGERQWLSTNNYSLVSDEFHSAQKVSEAALVAASASSDRLMEETVCALVGEDAEVEAELDRYQDGGLSRSIWPQGAIPDEVEGQHQALVERLSSAPNHLNWWRNWYLQMWDGTFQDWDFALEVAKIDDAIWEQGPRAVADEIERLERGYRDELRAEIERLRAALAPKAGDRLGIGGNNPPEAIDDLPPQSRETLVIWDALIDLQAQTKTNSPNKARAKAALDRLVDAAKACGVWAAGHIDTAVGEAVKTAGKTSGKYVVRAAVAGVAGATAWLAGYGPQIEKIIELAKTWVGALPL